MLKHRIEYHNPFFSNNYVAYANDDYMLTAFMSQLGRGDNILTLSNATTIGNEDETISDSRLFTSMDLQLFQSFDGQISTYMTKLMHDEAQEVTYTILCATRPSVEKLFLVSNMMRKRYQSDVYSVLIDVLQRVLPKANTLENVDIVKYICNVEYITSLKMEGWFE